MWNSYDARRKERGCNHEVVLRNAYFLPTEDPKTFANDITGDMNRA